MPTATDVVRLLTCVQSEECAHAFWSLGLRCSAATMAEVQAEFDAGRFLRTHILRPTWHLVPAEDIRWILIMNAELEGLICSGRCAAHSIPMRCLDKRVPARDSMLTPL